MRYFILPGVKNQSALTESGWQSEMASVESEPTDLVFKITASYEVSAVVFTVTTDCSLEVSNRRIQFNEHNLLMRLIRDDSAGLI